MAATLPALKLLDFFRDLEEGRRSGARQTLMQTELTRKCSHRPAMVGAVDQFMMANWLEQWDFGRGAGDLVSN
ncbi:hypothetical protein F4808DRAFT_435393 [Astrocystis sublimbata]|nr:hypothetical protein F4808DRAFT_435393 [Astrocystis sublimbata]